MYNKIDVRSQPDSKSQAVHFLGLKTWNKTLPKRHEVAGSFDARASWIFALRCFARSQSGSQTFIPEMMSLKSKTTSDYKVKSIIYHNLNLQHFSGLTFLESWDWTSVDSECIMSREKLWSSIFEINIIYIYIHLTGCANIRLEMENSRRSVILLYRRVATANTLLTVNANQTWSKPFRPWMHLPIQNNSIYTLHPTCPRDERQINDARGMLVGASSVSQFNISCSKVWIEPLQMMPMSRPASWLGTTHLKPSSNK